MSDVASDHQEVWGKTVGWVSDADHQHGTSDNSSGPHRDASEPSPLDGETGEEREELGMGGGDSFAGTGPPLPDEHGAAEAVADGEDDQGSVVDLNALVADGAKDGAPVAVAPARRYDRGAVVDLDGPADDDDDQEPVVDLGAPAAGDGDPVRVAAADDDDQEPVVDLGAPVAGDGDPVGVVADDGDDQESAGEPKAAPRYNRAIAFGSAAAAIVTSLVIGGGMVAMRQSPHTADQDHPTHPSTQVSIAAAPPATTGVAAGGQDAPIPYTATAVGCLPGSTTAQSVAGTDPTQAWVCVHGGSVGQHLVINLGRTMVVTGVSVTPGWVGADASGADQWLQHQVVKRLQWSFNDSPPTVVPQETRSVHGEAPQALPGRGVLASRIILLIQETGRAPADTAPSATPNPAPGAGGILDDVLGPTPAGAPTPTSIAVLPGLPADQSRTDPADNTFAVSSVKIFGHPPQ